MPLEKLEKYSNLIVEAKVIKVETLTSLQGCWKSKNRALVKILKTLKGPPKNTAWVHFKIWNPKARCTGQPDPILVTNQKRKLYLRCNKEFSCSPTHWNGVKRIK